MNLKKIQAFTLIAQYHNFSRAAVHLSVSQSLLSKYVIELEADLGVRLLYRNGRGVQLTPEGEKFLSYARQLDSLLNEAIDEVKGMQNNPAGNVCIGLSSAIGASLTIPVLKHLREQYPLIKIQVIEGISGYVHEWLNTGRLDMAVVFDIYKNDTVTHENLTKEDLLLVSPPGSTVTISTRGKELKNLPFLLTGQNSKMRLLIDTYTGKLGFHLTPIAEIDSLQNLIRGVEAGIGHTILPYGSIRTNLLNQTIQVSRITDPIFSRTIHLATSTQRTPTRAARIVADLIKLEVKKLAASDYWRPTDEMLSIKP
ncbi:LysR family transcriptional regulator [Advenella sp. WQ 585]|uniref:LysR family transcriptional regulator n=1 Tax=Advenella mandrilli TaxID=2800330 RepID=A0ABS1E8R0_9BURK|nr:LysR family transcriptional regulator [Advenella mandrilli]MBK1779691.1 LysR family transcriptional regulator [Advenella mandrilli]